MKIGEDIYELSSGHFDDFVRQCKYFVELFGLYDWDFHYKYGESEELRAGCTSSAQGKVCIIYLSKVWYGVEPTPEALRKIAFHEIWELLTSDLEVLGRGDFELTNAGRKEVLERARHTLIRRMENCVLPYLPRI